MTATEAGAKWSMHRRTVIKHCKLGNVPGARETAAGWRIPVDAPPPHKGQVLLVDVPEETPVESDKAKQEREGRQELAGLRADLEAQGVRWEIALVKADIPSIEKFRELEATQAERHAAQEDRERRLDGREQTLEAGERQGTNRQDHCDAIVRGLNEALPEIRRQLRHDYNLIAAAHAVYESSDCPYHKDKMPELKLWLPPALYAGADTDVEAVVDDELVKVEQQIRAIPARDADEIDPDGAGDFDDEDEEADGESEG